MFGRHETGKYFDPAFLDQIVVIAAAKLDTPILDDAEAATLRSILEIQLFEQQDAVRDALHLQIAIDRGQIIEEDHGALPGREELLEGDDLPTIPERTAGQQAQFGERVE